MTDERWQMTVKDAGKPKKRSGFQFFVLVRYNGFNLLNVFMKPKCTILALALFVLNAGFGQVKTVDVQVDTSFTGFTFAANFSGTKIYTADGKADFTSAKKPSAFSVTLALNTTFKDAFRQFIMLMSMAKQDGYTISDMVDKDTITNGNPGYYISFTETLKGTNYKNLDFYAFYIKDNNALIFTSGDLDNGKYIDNFKKTFYSIKI